MVAAAVESQSQFHTTKTHPLPRVGEVRFYALTDAGIFTATAPEEELSNQRSPLSKLGNAAQNVITQYRLIESTTSAP